MKKLLIAVTLMLIASPVTAKTRTVTSDSLVNMGEFKLTAFCPCEVCSGPYGRQTSTGAYARSGRTIAVDPDVIGYGTKILIGNTVYVAEDCGGCVKGDHIDIFVDTHEEVEDFEVKYKNVWIVRGNWEE